VLLAPRYVRPHPLVKIVQRDLGQKFDYRDRTGNNKISGYDVRYDQRIQAAREPPADGLCYRPRMCFMLKEMHRI